MRTGIFPRIDARPFGSMLFIVRYYGFGPKGAKTMRVWIATMVLLLAAPVDAAAQDRFVSKLALPSGKTVVVAEGDFEARSIGSFSVRLYEAAAAPDETTFFTSGLIRPRDGFVEKVILADTDGDRHQEIVIIVRSVGTGSYLSAHAVAVAGDKLIFRAAVEGLDAGADPIEALRKFQKKQE